MDNADDDIEASDDSDDDADRSGNIFDFLGYLCMFQDPAMLIWLQFGGAIWHIFI